MLAGDHLGDDHALALALVREHRRAGHVADGVDALGGRLHPLVDLDEAAVGELDAGLLEPDVLDVRRAAGGDEHLVDHELLLLRPRRASSVTESLPTLALEIRAPVMMSIFRFLKHSPTSVAHVGVLERQDRRAAPR